MSAADSTAAELTEAGSSESGANGIEEEDSSSGVDRATAYREALRLMGDDDMGSDGDEADEDEVRASCCCCCAAASHSWPIIF